MSAPTVSKMRRPSSPSRHTSAKSNGLSDCLEAVSSASNLQVGESQGRRLRRHGRPPDVVRRRVFKDSVDDAGAVEASDDGQPSGDGGGLEPSDVLHPPQIQLEVVALRVQRRELSVLTPGEEDPEV